MKKRWRINVNFIEEGDIYFFYKPKKAVETVSSFFDVGRFYFVLDPFGETPTRYIVMGGKKMPTVNDGGQASWGMIQTVGGRGFQTIIKAKSLPKGSARAAGEGVYTIVQHRDHTHLIYALELPRKLGPVQESLQIEKQADYLLLQRPPKFTPKAKRFSGFKPIWQPEVLRQGTELLLIGVNADPGRLGLEADTDEETLDSADLIRELRLDPRRHSVKPLISGNWY
jgi:hypothetical protein